MISKIEIRNFKSLKRVSVETRNLNLLLGLNGMGKSSFIQMLLLLMQSDKLEEQVIDLNGVLVKIGLGRDAMYQFAEDEKIQLGLSFGLETVENTFSNYLKKKGQLLTPEQLSILKTIDTIEGKFSIGKLLEIMNSKDNAISPGSLINNIVLLTDCKLVIKVSPKDNKDQYEKVQHSDFNWNFLYQTDKDKLHSLVGYRKVAMEFFRLQTKNFQYISAERIGPKDIYEASSVVVSDKKQLGLFGEYAAYFIDVFGLEYNVDEKLRHPGATSEKLKSQANAWLTEISPGISLNTKYVPEANKVILDYQFDIGSSRTNSFRPKNVGFGISYVLPIVLALLTAEEGKIIVIENPESHIHPKGQAKLGKLISLAASIGAQLFVETHSDHILNGIRVAVKENLVDKSKVNVMYFEKTTTEKEQFTKITQIEVDKNGELSEYPKDFLDEWSNQLLKLLK
jgi:predicted ATPase